MSDVFSTREIAALLEAATPDCKPFARHDPNDGAAFFGCGGGTIETGFGFTRTTKRKSIAADNAAGYWLPFGHRAGG